MKKHLILILMLSIFVSCKDKKEITKDSDSVPTKNIDIGGLYQYYHSNPVTLEQKEENSIIDFAADNNMEAVRTRSGIYIVNHTEGAGDSIKWGDPIKVHYRGYFMNDQEFDSSIKRGKPISFRVGSMVPGWNEAIPFLMEGSKATFIIPSHMGYGKRGFPGFVGPDEILIFDIEILEKMNQNK
jgi:FKBP-type peptidyl-prolyl cis-trans isomerase